MRSPAPSPRIAVLIPSATRSSVLTSGSEQALEAMATVINPPAADVQAKDLPALLSGATACLTGWGTPRLPDDLLDQYPDLQLVAHTAGSIRRLIPSGAIERGLKVSHAASVIADAVAEHIVASVLQRFRPLHLLDQHMKSGGEWLDVRNAWPGRLVGAHTVGIVGAGYVGRVVIRLFRALGCHMLVSDPLLTSDQATSLGVERVHLHQLLRRADIISLHAPVLPETRGMIGRDELGMIRDGSLFINTARAALVDEQALYVELASGRLDGMLDVFATEPLPSDSPFRRLTNVLVTPHSAGHTIDTHQRQGQAMVEETHRYLAGQPLQHEVTAAMLATMA